jgi:hypothetical protein
MSPYSSSLHALSNNLLLTFAFAFPFNFGCVGSASLTFCVALVVQRDRALACEVDSSGAHTLSLAGR